MPTRSRQWSQWSIDPYLLIVSGAKGVSLRYAPRSPKCGRGTQSGRRQDFGLVLVLKILHPGECQTAEQSGRTITRQQAFRDEQELHLPHLFAARAHIQELCEVVLGLRTAADR